MGDLQADMRGGRKGSQQTAETNKLLLWVGEKQLEKCLPKDSILRIILRLTLWYCLNVALRDLDSPAFPAKHVLETDEGLWPSHACLQ